MTRDTTRKTSFKPIAEDHPTSGRTKTGPADAEPLDRTDRDP
jgi:hypothetical protein